MSKDTELGIVRWSNAREGWTQGLPGFRSTEWETSPPDENGWVRVRVPRETLEELVRTPGYRTIQGERWLFCCREPMVFIGCWQRELFVDEAEGADGKALFESIVERVVPGLWENALGDDTGIYVFECAKCGTKRGHWDLA